MIFDINGLSTGTRTVDAICICLLVISSSFCPLFYIEKTQISSFSWSYPITLYTCASLPYLLPPSNLLKHPFPLRLVPSLDKRIKDCILASIRHLGRAATYREDG